MLKLVFSQILECSGTPLVYKDTFFNQETMYSSSYSSCVQNYLSNEDALLICYPEVPLYCHVVPSLPTDIPILYVYIE